MTVTANTLRKLGALGLNAEQMAGVLELLAEGLELEEKRKAVQSERKRRSRDRRVNVTGQERDNSKPPSPLVPPSLPPETPNSPPYNPPSPKPSAGKTRGSRFNPEAMPSLPDTWKAYASSKGMPGPQAEREFLKFSNYWSAASGPNAVKVDWYKTWQNRVLDVAQWAAEKSGGEIQPQGLRSAGWGDGAWKFLIDACLEKRQWDSTAGPPPDDPKRFAQPTLDLCGTTGVCEMARKPREVTERAKGLIREAITDICRSHNCTAQEAATWVILMATAMEPVDTDLVDDWLEELPSTRAEMAKNTEPRLTEIGDQVEWWCPRDKVLKRGSVTETDTVWLTVLGWDKEVYHVPDSLAADIDFARSESES